MKIAKIASGRSKTPNPLKTLEGTFISSAKNTTKFFFSSHYAFILFTSHTVLA